MSQTSSQEKNPIQVAGRLFDVLEYLAEHGCAGVTQLSSALQLNKSTTHRLLSSLEYMGYVREDETAGRYEATFKLVYLSSQIIEHTDVIRVIRPYLQKLSEDSKETVHLVRREGPDVVYIDKVESYVNHVRMVSRIGSRMPFYRSAVGKALAANMKPEEIEDLWNSSTIERTTPYTITNLHDFEECLDEVRRKGYALDNEENERGVRCVAVALDIAGDNTTYAFSISVPVSRMDNDRIKVLAKNLFAARDEINAAFHSQ